MSNESGSLKVESRSTSDDEVTSEASLKLRRQRTTSGDSTIDDWIPPEPTSLETGQHFVQPGAFRMITSWSTQSEDDEESPPPPPPPLEPFVQSAYLVEADLVSNPSFRVTDAHVEH